MFLVGVWSRKLEGSSPMTPAGFAFFVGFDFTLCFIFCKSRHSVCSWTHKISLHQEARLCPTLIFVYVAWMFMILGGLSDINGDFHSKN